jgi:hypothetical protein
MVPTIMAAAIPIRRELEEVLIVRILRYERYGAGSTPEGWRLA